MTAITSYDSSVTQGSDGHSITFAFTLGETVAGELFAVGDKLTVSTNIGKLFSATYPLPDITVTDDENKPLVSVSISEDTVTFTILEGGAGTNEISGNATTGAVLTAKDVGVTAGESASKDLTIGGATVAITFTQPAITPPGTGSSTNPGTVDIDTFWKNGYATEDHTGASITMEVNPHRLA